MFTSAPIPQFDRDRENARVRDLLVRGIAAAKGKAKEEARFYLEWVLRAPDATPEQCAEAWRYLAEISDGPKAKREALEHVLAFAPMDPSALRALAILDGELKPEEIVNPDRLPASAATASPQPIEARRFVCPQCGGKMAFTPDGTTLTCAYCGYQQSILAAMEEGAIVEEQNFFVALATQKGHTHPTLARTIQCQGCGASFVLAPETISSTCPYCGAAYAVEQAKRRELIAPEGIVPFAVTQDDALRATLRWLEGIGFRPRGKFDLPSGVYLPVWTFDLGGEITWNCLQQENDAWVPRSGSRIIFENDLRVPASHTLSAALLGEISDFPLGALVPYDARYLADWLAETYEIPVGDASLVARSRVVAKERAAVAAGLFGAYRDLHLGTARLVVESYKLILLPLWVARYSYEKKRYSIVVNGQTGTVRGEKPKRGVAGWWASLLGG